MRLIDADALKEDYLWCKSESTPWDYTWDTAMERVDMQPTIQPESANWISVKDKLPETGGEYLVVIKGDIYRTVTIRSFTLNLHKLDPYLFDGKRNCKPGWYWNDSEYGYVDDDRVTHWQELPELPKEKENG